MEKVSDLQTMDVDTCVHISDMETVINFLRYLYISPPEQHPDSSPATSGRRHQNEPTPLSITPCVDSLTLSECDWFSG